MSAKVLFACSKCFSRHPYEELSSGQQLCKVNIIKMRNSEYERETHRKCNKQKHFNLSYVCVCVCMHSAKSKGCVRGRLFFLAIT